MIIFISYSALKKYKLKPLFEIANYFNIKLKNGSILKLNLFVGAYI